MGKRNSHHTPSFDGGGSGDGRRNKRRKSSDHEISGGENNVFVGNLKYGTTWWALKDHMRQAGNVDSANILESNGRSKGCAVVQYQHPKEAKRAISELNESLLDGRKIFVQPDNNPRESSSPSNNNGGGGGGGGEARRHENTSSAVSYGIYVGNLPYECSWQSLKDFFKSCGSIDRADVTEDPVTKRKKGWGVVYFSTDRAVETAIRKFHGTDFQGRTLEVRRDKKSSSSSSMKPVQQQQSRSNNNLSNFAEEDEKFLIFVGNLDYDCSWQDLKDLVQQRCGRVLHADIPKRGWGIITFATHREGAAAISKLDGNIFQNRPLEVRWNRKVGSSNDEPNCDGYRDPSTSSSSTTRQLYVGNLSYDCTWHNLKDAFKRYGVVNHAEICETGSGKSTGFGIVLFSDGKSAARAIESMNGVEFQGRNLSVRFDRRPGKLESEKGGSKRDQYDNVQKKDNHHRRQPKRESGFATNRVEEEKEERGNPLDNALSCPR